MTRADIVGWVRGLLVDDQADEDLITQAANWFVDELCNNNKLRIMEASELLTASAGDTDVELPDDLKTMMKDGFYMTTPQVADMQPGYMNYREFMRSFANFASATAAQLSSWTTFGNTLRFSAPLNVAHEFQLDYYRKPVQMEEDDDECEISDNYQELVSKGTLARMMEINEDYAEASNERGNLEPLVTAFIRNESRGGLISGPIQINAGRTRKGYRSSSRSF